MLCAKAASLPEAVGGAALLCDPMNVRAIASGLQYLAEQTAARNKLTELGFARAAEMSWDSAAEKLYAVYRELS